MSTRRLNVDIPESSYRRLKAYAALTDRAMPEATAEVLARGLDALGVPVLAGQPDQGTKGGVRYASGGLPASVCADRE